MAAFDLDRADALRAADPEGMLGLVEDFEEQCRRAVDLGSRAPVPERGEVRAVVMAGMGGSAIGGDLLRTCLAPVLGVPWVVHRDYGLPAWVGPDTLLLVGSYSGNTEETLSAFEEGVRRGATVVCLASGGTMAERARALGLPLVEVPAGLPPRAALGYSFFPLAVLLTRMGLAAIPGGDIEEALAEIGRSRVRWGRERSVDENGAKTLAHALVGSLPVVYSADGVLSSVALRWKGQFNENSKTLAYVNVFPEVDHNEIEGWEGAGEIGRRIHLILLRDREDTRRVQYRMEVTAGIIGARAGGRTEVWSRGTGRMARVFSLVCLGDFTSVYLALLTGQDPTPVDNIGRLKEALAGMPVSFGPDEDGDRTGKDGIQ